MTHHRVTPAASTVSGNQVDTLRERAKTLFATAAILYSPITHGELMEVLLYGVQHFNELTDMLATDNKPSTGSSDAPEHKPPTNTRRIEQ